MCDVIKSLTDVATRIDWLEAINAIASTAMAVIAGLALKSWKSQDKAKREAEFLDILVEAMHGYIAKISASVSFVEIYKIGIKSYEPLGDSDDREIKGAVTYIERNGEQASKRLFEALDTARPSMIQLKTLAAKGQVFKFRNYTKCHKAVEMLTWQFDRMEAFASFIGSNTLNWSNPKGLEVLKKILTIQSEDIRKYLQESNIAILEFTKETYSRLYD